jgi:hypothetical protein
MTHEIASLLHHLATACVDDDYTQILGQGRLCDAMPGARALGLVESPNLGRPLCLEQYWLRLTVRGRNVVEEMLAVGRELVRE